MSLRSRRLVDVRRHLAAEEPDGHLEVGLSRQQDVRGQAGRHQEVQRGRD